MQIQQDKKEKKKKENGEKVEKSYLCADRKNVKILHLIALFGVL